MTTLLSSRVFLAFDDISYASKNVLRFAKIGDTQACLVLPESLIENFFLPAHLCRFIQIYQYPDTQVAIITVNTNKLDVTQRWDVADALVSAMSTEVAGDTAVDVAALSEADPSWEIKDPWLVVLLHLIKVEQWPRTHLLLAKGYKPGRNLLGTYEAVDSLSRALQLFTKDQMTVERQQMHQELPKVLAKEKMRMRKTTDDHLALLYH
ncbi:unnamed protein product [Peronospora belbahrii]|uniref:Uncharacterized protein n=1 Tax=Peronospora belbahrii TaxID=622444 RepID=A0ABN8D2N4_9STRA|nr:unnamed protein product [Peronospora belbahrii]